MRFSEFRYITARKDRSIDGEYSRLSRNFRAGDIVRLNPSIYMPTEQWLSLKAQDRLQACVGAVALAARPHTFVGATTLGLYEIPLVKPGVLESPQIFVGVKTLGSVRVRTPIGCYGNLPDARVRYAAQNSGRQEVAVLPQPPRIRGQLLSGSRSTELSLEDWSYRVATETLSQALIRCIHSFPFESRVVIIEHLLRSGTTLLSEIYEACGRQMSARADGTVRWTKEFLIMLAQGQPIPHRRRAFEEAIAFATLDNESVGESLSHALIHKLGFEAPQLQVPMQLPSGRFVRPDYFWPNVRVVGEFDGAHKYTKSMQVSGKEPSQVVYEEKLREDGIRSLGHRVCRWTWADLMNPERLARILSNAGVPRSSGVRQFGD